MEEFKTIIRGVPNEMLNSFLAVYIDLLSQVPQMSPAYDTFLSMVRCIKDELEKRGMDVNGSYVSESDKKRAMNYLTSHGVSVKDDTPIIKEKSSFLEVFLGFVGFIAIIIVIAIAKGLFDVIVNLWNSGVLKVVLGLGIAGGGVYLGYKKGLFEKLKTYMNSEIEQIKDESMKQEIKILDKLYISQ